MYYRLKDRRDLLLQLKYIVIRLRLGDYEEGFRIPYQQNDNRKRTKKEFRRLEVYRLRTFYGVFNLNEFKSYYYAILNTYKGYSKAAFLMLLECRPINILNVLNVFPSIYFINQYLEHFSVEFPDSSENPSSHAPLSVGDILMLPIMSY